MKMRACAIFNPARPSVLAFGGILTRHLGFDEQLDIIAMRPHNRLAKPQLLRVRVRQITRKIVTVPRRESQLQCFSRATDLTMRRRGQGRQPLHQFRPHRAQLCSVFNQR